MLPGSCKIKLFSPFRVKSNEVSNTDEAGKQAIEVTQMQGMKIMNKVWKDKGSETPDSTMS